MGGVQHPQSALSAPLSGQGESRWAARTFEKRVSGLGFRDPQRSRLQVLKCCHAGFRGSPESTKLGSLQTISLDTRKRPGRRVYILNLKQYLSSVIKKSALQALDKSSD